MLAFSLGIGLAVVLGACAGGGPAPRFAPVAARAQAQDLQVAVGQAPFFRGTPPAPNLGVLVDAVNRGSSRR